MSMAVADLPKSSWLDAVIVELEAGQTAAMTGISWDRYMALSATRDRVREAVKIHFLDGRVCLMSPSFQHEQPSFRLNMIALTLAEAFGRRALSAGGTTLRRPDLNSAVEPDGSFYIANAARMTGLLAGRRSLDLSIHPPPDLAFETDITTDSEWKRDLYHGFGVPELWFFTPQRVTFYVREEAGYRETENSASFPVVTSGHLTTFMTANIREDDITFIQLFREWVRSLTTGAGGVT